MTMDINVALGTVGRALLALLFILAGIAKIAGPEPFREHMVQFQVPTILLYGVIALEFAGGLALLFGYQTRWTALALAVFCVLTAVIFHFDLGDKVQRTLFFKDLAIAGGLIALGASAALRSVNS